MRILCDGSHAKWQDLHTCRGVFNYAQDKKQQQRTHTQAKTHIHCIYPLHPFENSFSFTCKVAARGLEGHSRPLRDTVSEASPTIARLNTGTTQPPLMLHGRLEAAITNQRRNRGRLFCGALKGKFHVVHRKERGETKSTAAETEGGGRGENRLNRRSLRGRKKIQMRHKERKSGIVCRTENKSCCVAAQSQASGKEKLSSLCDFN